MWFIVLASYNVLTYFGVFYWILNTILNLKCPLSYLHHSTPFMGWHQCYQRVSAMTTTNIFVTIFIMDIFKWFMSSWNNEYWIYSKMKRFFTCYFGMIEINKSCLACCLPAKGRLPLRSPSSATRTLQCIA